MTWPGPTKDATYYAPKKKNFNAQDYKFDCTGFTVILLWKLYAQWIV